ncbi:MAG: tripartite tricarboxylate transporter TctB family protein, partial [Actinomycetota bacterium]
MLNKVSKAGKGELAFAGSLFLISLVVYRDTHKLVIPDNNVAVSPRTFPYIVATVLLLASIGVVIEVLRGRAATPEGVEPGEPFQRADFKTMGIIVGSIGLHVFLLERTGYIISAAISFWGVAYAFGARVRIRTPFSVRQEDKPEGKQPLVMGYYFAGLFLISLIFATVVYYSFTTFLDIQLPRWI